MVAGGVALIAGGILFYVFVMQGALGGGVGGMAVGGGGYLAIAGVTMKTLPNELIQIDQDNVYLGKTPICLDYISNVTYAGNTLTIVRSNGKKISQGFVRNCAECQQEIFNALNERRAGQPCPM